VVNLAIEDDEDRLVFVRHRLRAGRREVDDLEARVQQACVGPGPCSRAIGPTMPERAEDNGFVDGLRRSPEPARQAAHQYDVRRACRLRSKEATTSVCTIRIQVHSAL